MILTRRTALKATLRPVLLGAAGLALAEEARG